MAKILLIEDDKVVAASLAIFLKNDGHIVETAYDGMHGMASVAANPPDIVVTDLFMPEKDGLEAIRELRVLRPDLPVIAISGGGSLSSNDALRLAKSLGAQEILSKPILADQLRSAVKRCLPVAQL